MGNQLPSPNRVARLAARLFVAMLLLGASTSCRVSRPRPATTALSSRVREALRRPDAVTSANLESLTAQLVAAAASHAARPERILDLLALLSQHPAHDPDSLGALSDAVARLWREAPAGRAWRRFNRALTGRTPLRGVPHVSRGRRHAAASNSHQATAAAMEILRAGGNAADAAVTAFVMLWVTDPANVSPLGRSEWVLWARPGRRVALSAGTMFPSEARRRWRDLPRQRGWAAAPIPGNLAAIGRLVRERWTSLPLERLFAPAIATARAGFRVPRPYHTLWRSAARKLARDPATKRAFLKPGGEPFQAGDRFFNPGLARFLERVSVSGRSGHDGIDEFYRGAYGARLAGRVRQAGGLWTPADLRAYRTHLGGFWRARLGRYEIITPRSVQCRGYLLTEMLQILDEAVRLGLIGPGSGPLEPREVEALLLIEILAILDTRHRLGLYVTPDEEGALREITSRRLARRRALRLKELLAAPPAQLRRFLVKHRLLRAEDLGDDRDTTAWAVTDGKIWVQASASVGPWFGAKRALDGVIAGYSYRLAKPSRALERTSYDQTAQSPALVLDRGRPVLGIGAAGSRRILGAIFHTLALRLALRPGRPLGAAVASPRLYPRRGRIRTHVGFTPNVLAHLRGRGYGIDLTGRGVRNHLGVVSAVERIGPGAVEAAVDPTSSGSALAR